MSVTSFSKNIFRAVTILGAIIGLSVTVTAQDGKAQRNIFRNPSVKTKSSENQSENAPRVEIASSQTSLKNASNDIEVSPMASTDGSVGVEIVEESQISASATQNLPDNSSDTSPTVQWSEHLKALRLANDAKKPSEIYRIAAGDVLDIQLQATENVSTLFTVLEDRTLDFPLAGEILNVGGMTTDELALLLKEKVKGFDVSNLNVRVREYASHRLQVGGAVENGGEKILRREAVPLFAVLAEAHIKPEAARIQITRGKQQTVYSLSEAQSSEILVYPADTIEVLANDKNVTAQKFYYIIGAVNAPGEKEFHTEMTLTQAIFAAGGTIGNQAASRAVVLRQSPQGLLVTTEYNLKQIRQGKIADPLINAGDRIEIKK